MSAAASAAAFGVTIAFILTTIIKFKAHPVVSLVTGSFILAALCGVPLDDASRALASGFGSTMGGIGLLILWGMVTGIALQRSGCTDEIAALMLRAFGERRATLAVAVTGYVIAVPIFFTAAFAMLSGVVRELSRRGRVPFGALIASLSVGLLTSHSFVLPTPGSMAVVTALGCDMTVFLAYGVIVSLVSLVAGGVVYASAIGRRPRYRDDFARAFECEEPDEPREGPRPSGITGIALIFLSITVMMIGAAGARAADPGSGLRHIMSFAADKNVAMMLGACVAFAVLRKYMEISSLELVGEAAREAGPILAITAAGGAFGAVVSAAGVGEHIVTAAAAMGSSSAAPATVLAAWCVSQVMRSAQGSGTVALAATSAVFAPIVAQMDVSPILVGLAICAGGVGLSMPNDSGFWVVSKFSRLSMRETFECWTAPGTVSGVTALVCTLILCAARGILPGLQ